MVVLNNVTKNKCGVLRLCKKLRQFTLDDQNETKRKLKEQVASKASLDNFDHTDVEPMRWGW